MSSDASISVASPGEAPASSADSAEGAGASSAEPSAVDPALLTEQSHPLAGPIDDPRPAGPGDVNPFAERLPNTVVRTHEGKAVRFYDDLIKGKIVLINFMYSTCKGR